MRLYIHCLSFTSQYESGPCYHLSLFFSGAIAVGPQAAKVRPSNLPTFRPVIAGALDGTAFAQWISRQVKAGRETIASAHGAYQVVPGSDQPHVVLSNLHGVTIWMDSVNLTMTSVGVTAFNINECSDLTLYGLTVWWDTPGFAQATITGVQNSGANDFDIQSHLDDGYNSSFLFNASTGQMNGEYTNPQSGRLEAGPGWSTITGTPSAVNGKENTFTVPLKGSYFVSGPLVIIVDHLPKKCRA